MRGGNGAATLAIMSADVVESTLDRAEEAGSPYLATQARRYLCETLLERDSQDPEAAEHLSVASESARQHEFALELEAIERLTSRRLAI